MSYKTSHTDTYFKTSFDGWFHKTTQTESYYKTIEGAVQETDAPIFIMAYTDVDGEYFVIQYQDASGLDTTSVPDVGDFVFSGSSSTISSIEVTNFEVIPGLNIGAVILNVDNPIYQGEVLSLSYTPGANPIQDVAGNLAAALSNQSVTNNSTQSSAQTYTGTGQETNGIDQYLYVQDNGDLDIAEAATDFCYGGYITTGSSIVNARHIFGKGMIGTVSGLYTFLTFSSRIRAQIYTSTGVTTIFSEPVSTNTEYHLLMRVDKANSRIYFYVDGVLQNAGGTAFTGTFSSMANAFDFCVAARNDSFGAGHANFFGGTFRDVRVYNKDVSGDIDTWMAGDEIGDEVAWWCLSDGDFTDLTGNGYDLTSVNI